MGTALALMLGLVMTTGALVLAPQGAAALPTDAWVTGVVDDGVDPIPGVYVKLMMFMSGSIDVGYAFTDSNGEYTVGVPGGFEYMVIAANGSYYMGMTTVSVDVGETAWANLTLDPIAVVADVTIKGYVKDAMGVAATGGHVLGISNDEEGGDMPSYANVTTSDGSGYFEVNVIPSGAGGGAVAFDYEGYAMVDNSSDSAILSGQTYWFNITLLGPGQYDDAAIYGHVTDADTGLPLEGVLVSVEIENEYLNGLGERYNNYTFTDASGDYEMDVTHGTARIWFIKGGYTMGMYEDEDIPYGSYLQFDASLTVLDCLVRGNVTDLKYGGPVTMGQVFLRDVEGNMAMAMIDASGFYELEAFSGEDMYLVAQADGYASNYTIITLNPADDVWQDFGLHPLSAWINGTVTDILTDLPVEGAWVSASGPSFSNGDDTNASGYYNISVAPGNYQMWVNAMGYRDASADVTVVDDTSTVQDFELIPRDIPETVLVSGNVTDFDSTDPIVDARVRVAFPDMSSTNETRTNSTGFYEMYVAPLDGMPVSVTAGGYAPYYTTIDCGSVSSVSLDVQLVKDSYMPNATLALSPNENVSWTNPMTIDAEAEDAHMRDLALYNLAPWYSEVGMEHKYIFAGASASFDPFYGYSSLEYSQVGDVYTVHDTFDGTVDNDYSMGGWLTNLSDSVYLSANKHWWGSDAYYGVRAVFSNATLSYIPGGAFFDQDTGEYLFFNFDWGFPQAYPDDADAYLRFNVSQIAIEEANPLNWTWYGDGTLCEGFATDFVFSADPTVPSGDYAMLFLASDFAEHWNLTIKTYSVDNDLPVADAGDDIDDAVTDVEVTLNGSRSSDNVGIVDYTWEFDDGGTVTLSGQIAKYTFTSDGSYEVLLTVVDGAGHESSDTVLVTVSLDMPPTADAGEDQPDVVEGDTVTFDGSGSWDDVGVVNYTWTIVDLSVEMYGVSPTYTFDLPGVYDVELVVNDTIGQTSDPDTMVVTVNDITDPVADAGEDQPDVSYGDEVTLDGSGSSDNVAVVLWNWTFDDDGSVTIFGETATHTFSAPGEYNITLTVADAAGNEDTDWVVVTVIDDEPPVADAGEDPEGVVVGETVILNGSGSSDNYLIATYTWVIDDDGTDVILDGMEVEYAFMAEGDYTATLTVTDFADNTDSDVVIIRVGPVNAPPVANAGFDQKVEEGDTVTFDGSDSSDDVGIEEYTWTFEYDDETKTLTGESPEFVFKIPGTYIVTLNVTDAEGEWDTDTVVIVVEEKPATFLTEYWWLFAVIAAVVVMGALLMLMKRGGKGRPGPSKGPDEDEELEEEDLPPPDDEDI
jgi:PKD repeat protein